ncbi:hypothetical protein VaNZ11_012086, partial [Volvox africanus]
IIIDALRYDFFFGSANRKGQMPLLTGLLAEAGAASVAYKFVADTPTITMSRLKALLTGGLPTFLDIGQSFSAAAISEDNLLAQMYARGMRVVVMGDDTWAQLAPLHYYAACHPYPAFDVRDLHTVDDGVWQHLPSYLRHVADCSNCNTTAYCSTCFANAAAGGPGSNCSSSGPDSYTSPAAGSGARTRDEAYGWKDSGAAPQTPPTWKEVPDEALEAVVEAPGPRWDVLIAHYLGVDHAGHTHGGDSPEMNDKLRDMDEQVTKVAEMLLAGAGDGSAGAEGPYSRTLLLVLGDHGQTMSGDHGGGSDEERDSVLLAFHVGLWKQARERAAAAAASGATKAAGETAAASTVGSGDPDGDEAAAKAIEAGKDTPAPEAVRQIDLTPTLALLLGLPIPYGNLGKVNRRLWDMAHGEGNRHTTDHSAGGCSTSTNGSAKIESHTSQISTAAVDGASAEYEGTLGCALRSYVAALRANAVQVGRYLTSYAIRGGLPSDELAHCTHLLRAADEGFCRLTQRGSRSGSYGSCADYADVDGASSNNARFGEDEVESLYAAFLEAAGALARRKFTRFHLPSMAVGCFLAVGCVALHGWLLSRLCRWKDLLNPISIGALGAALTHALGLFSANWIQGEGRILCYSLEAAGLLLWLLAILRSDFDDGDNSDRDGYAALAVAPKVQCTNSCSRPGYEFCDNGAATRANGYNGGHKRDGVGGYGGGGCTCSNAMSCTAESINSSTVPSGLHECRGLDCLKCPVALPQHPGHNPVGPQLPGPQRHHPQRHRRLRRSLWGVLRRQAHLVGMLAAALTCNVALQRYSLIDRWGSDPHDKRQLAAAGMAVAVPQDATSDGGSSGTATGLSHSMSLRALLMGAVETLVPLGLLSALLGALRPRCDHRKTAAGSLARRGARQQHPQSSWRQLQWRLLGAVPFQLAAAWWALQLTGLGGLSLRAAVAPVTAAVLAPARVFLAMVLPLLPPSMRLQPREVLSLLMWMLRVAVPHLTTMQLSKMVATVSELPLRLLLPRLVYLHAGLAMLQILLLVVARLIEVKARWRRQQRLLSPHEAVVRPSAAAAAKTTSHIIGVVALMDDCGNAGTLVSAEAMIDATCTVVSSVTAVVSLLLGRRGPAIMLLLWVNGLAIFGLLLAAGRLRSSRRVVQQDVSAEAGPPSGPAAGLEVAAGALLAALSTHAFFLTGHFCEFSGLQYDSPFVGFDHMSWPATPILFWLNSFGAFMLPTMALPLAAAALTTALEHNRNDNVHGQCYHHHTYGQAGAKPPTHGRTAPAVGASHQKSALQLRSPQLQGHEVNFEAVLLSAPGGDSSGDLDTCSAGVVLLVALSSWRSLSLCVAMLSAGLQRHHVVVWALFAPKLVFEVCFTVATYMALPLAAVSIAAVGRQR